MKVSPSPDIILCGWLGLKHQLTNSIGRVFGSLKVKSENAGAVGEEKIGVVLITYERVAQRARGLHVSEYALQVDIDILAGRR